MKFTILTSAIFILLSVSVLTITGYGQSAAKPVAAAEIIAQIADSRAVNYENLSVSGDLDLSNLPSRTNDAVYPEGKKTAKVFTAKIMNSIIFKNVTFNGKLIFFRSESNANEIREYRLVFADSVKFISCTFNKSVNFELTNFDGGVSFQNSIFKAQSLFIRVGLQKVPDFKNTIFEQGATFQNFQNDTPRNFSAVELEHFYAEYLKSGE